MSSLRISSSITPTLTGIVFATALGSASINTFANVAVTPHHHEAFHKAPSIDLNSTAQTFSSVALTHPSQISEIDNLMLQVFENISKDSKPLDEKFAKILSDNLLDLF